MIVHRNLEKKPFQLFETAVSLCGNGVLVEFLLPRSAYDILKTICKENNLGNINISYEASYYFETSYEQLTCVLSMLVENKDVVIMSLYKIEALYNERITKLAILGDEIADYLSLVKQQ